MLGGPRWRRRPGCILDFLQQRRQLWLKGGIIQQGPKGSRGVEYQPLVRVIETVATLLGCAVTQGIVDRGLQIVHGGVGSSSWAAGRAWSRVRATA